MPASHPRYAIITAAPAATTAARIALSTIVATAAAFELALVVVPTAVVAVVAAVVVPVIGKALRVPEITLAVDVAEVLGAELALPLELARDVTL
ncbi:hypothetical protein SAICODRAFT_30298 [Saitoella complicata NRRL Y-17804]|uniref:uncharacterized protein n=1 Tax=Saitoella complicata (strain BCRC 22490 / CBS 7301 / JCM 7358 / NBRC 10748 / NRRL Y-17804) TaxID=698492 RepID=UPI0008674416|nr:uncharacterized protein SAICODRAFT_30298 [Saitoella complicata NRRL Y-17804]ODQ53267.1 hypothetical protein SAICODRAFT_30298 [Saitoella complicata NRRL Y-17804]